MSDTKLPKLDQKVEDFSTEIRATLSFDAEKKAIALADNVAELAVKAFDNELVTEESIKAVSNYNNFFKASSMLAVGRECTERAKENKELDVVTASGKLIDKSGLTMTWARRAESTNPREGDDTPIVRYGSVKATINHAGDKNGSVSAVAKILKAEGAAALSD